MRSQRLTVLTPPASTDLTTLAIVKEELAIPDASTDSLLARWITESSAQIAGYCGRTLGASTVTETFRLSPFSRVGRHVESTDSLRLRQYPVTDVASVVEGNGSDDGSDVSLDATEYGVDAEAGLLSRLILRDDAGGLRRRWWALSITVTYSGGFDLPASVPLQLQMACLLLMKHRWSARTRDPALRQINIPGLVEKVYWIGGTQDGLPPEAAELADDFAERGI